MSPRTRSVMDLAPRDAQPPIREPNMPEKRDRKDDSKEQADKKPVIKTLSNEEPAYKYQWGVRVPDASPEPGDLEKSPNYVVTHKWGVNISKYKEPEGTTSINADPIAMTPESNVQKAVEANIEKIQATGLASQVNQAEIKKLTSTASTAGSPETSIAQAQSAENVSQVLQTEFQNLTLPASTLESPQTSPSLVSTDHEKIAPRSAQPAARPGVDLTSGIIVPGDDDYNIPTEIPHGSEISAWRDVVIRSKLHEEELARTAAIELVGDPAESIFIRPEPPQPKLDVRVVGTASDVVSPEENVAKPLEVGSNTPAMNFATTKKFHTCAIACRRLPSACHRSMLANFSSSSSDDGQDLRSSFPEPEEPSKIETGETREIQASQKSPGPPKVEEDLSSVLQDLSQREMEVLLSYTRHGSEETGTYPTLPTSVTISTFPAGSTENTSEYTQPNGNEIFNSECSNVSGEIAELERTIMKFKDGGDKEDGKEIKDKKDKKDGDYIRIPGDPYPYSREHYEKWRVPHGKCPIVNDDVPKAKPAETSDSPRNSTNPEEHPSSWGSRKENNRKSSGSMRVTAVGAEQPTDRVKTIHPDIEAPKRDVVDVSTPKHHRYGERSQGEDGPASTLDSPETIARRIEGHIVRGAMDEERRARNALKLLKARDKKIAFLEKRIADFEGRAGGDCSPRIASWPDFSSGDSSLHSTGRDTTYLSLPPTEPPVSQRHRDDATRNQNIVDNHEKMVENLSIPRLKLPATSVPNSENDAVILKGVNSDFEDSSLASEDFRREESSVDLVVTAALAFSKFNEDRWSGNDAARVTGDGRAVNDSVMKKSATGISSSLPWMKTRGSRRLQKRVVERKIGKSRGGNGLSRNLQELQADLDALLARNSREGNSSVIGAKRKVEDKVVQEDAQEAAGSTPHDVRVFDRKTASTQTCADFKKRLYDPSVISSEKTPAIGSKNNFLEHERVAKVWAASDEPAPQWLIEEALNRGKKFAEKNRSDKTNGSPEEHEDIIATKFGNENIISDLEKQLCATRVELTEALTEQSIIKDKYKKALKNAKIAADEERDELQRKLVRICTSAFEKFGPNALGDNRVRPFCKKHHRPLQHFGKLSRKLHRKLKIANLTSAKLREEVLSVKKNLDEKTLQYNSMVKCITDLKSELKNTESNLNDLLKENASLRKRIDEAREWMQTRVGKERSEKINAAQFREIQRSRELANLKKKNEEDLSTIAQLRGKLLRTESAHSNRGFLLNSYKSQLAELSKEKEKLSVQIKELENENSSLRNSNAQLKANVTLMSREKERLAADSEKSDIVERMQTKLATKYERSMLQKIDTMKEKYEKVVATIEDKLKAAENLATQYFEAIKRFLKEIHEYHRELDAERDFNCSEASEREAHETACTILNITPGELTGFLRGRSSNSINSWLSDVQRITMKKSFAEDLGSFLFARAIGSAKN